MEKLSIQDLVERNLVPTDMFTLRDSAKADDLCFDLRINRKQLQVLAQDCITLWPTTNPVMCGAQMRLFEKILERQSDGCNPNLIDYCLQVRRLRMPFEWDRFADMMRNNSEQVRALADTNPLCVLYRKLSTFRCVAPA